MAKRKERRLEAFQQALARCETWMQEDVDAIDRLAEVEQGIQACISQVTEAESMEVRPSSPMPSSLRTGSGLQNPSQYI